MTLCNALFGGYMPRCAAFVGSGGKTTTIKALASELCSGGHSVIITTTTKMRLPGDGEPFANTACDARKLLSHHACVTAGLPAPDGFKMMGLPPEELSKLVETGAYVLVEADGARTRPLKMTASHEPVIPPEAEAVVALAGMDAIGQPLCQVCHRWELALPILCAEPDAPVTPDMVAALLRHCYLDAFPETRFTVLLNKCDDGIMAAYAKNVADALPGVKSVAKGSAIFGGVQIISLEN